VLADLMRHHLRAVILGILIICGGTISTYVFNYMTTYAITTLHRSPTIGTALAMTGSLAAMAGLAVGAWADRFGRKPMLIASRVVFVLIIYPRVPHHHLANRLCHRARRAQHVVEFHLLDRDGGVLCVHDGGVPEIRTVQRTWHSLRPGGDIFGGTTQFAVAWLIDWTKDPMVPAWYQMAANVVAIIGIMLLTPHPEALRERVAHVDRQGLSRPAP
jgi:hypothetical protein